MARAPQFGGAEEQEDSEDASSGDDVDTTLLKDTDRVHILEQMLEMLHPKENVAKALRRLGESMHTNRRGRMRGFG